MHGFLISVGGTRSRGTTSLCAVTHSGPEDSWNAPVVLKGNHDFYQGPQTKTELTKLLYMHFTYSAFFADHRY